MSADGERGKRAGDYINGRMDEAERRRAERDLEFDPAFRDAVIRLADEMRLFDPAEDRGGAGERWKLVAARLAELPQMRSAGMAGGSARPLVGPSARRAVGIGPHTPPRRRAAVIVLGLIVAFALGYVAAKL